VRNKERSPEFYMELLHIIYQQSLCGRSVKFEHVMRAQKLAVNLIRSHGLNHYEFQSLLSETDAEYGGILYHIEV
jgi:hypothetical protein